MNRRQFTQTSAVAGAALTLSPLIVAGAQPAVDKKHSQTANRGGSEAQSSKKTEGKIDTHHHIFPPVLAEWIGPRMALIVPGGAKLNWSEELSLSNCDLFGVAKAITSMPVNMLTADRDKSKELMVACNDVAARLVQDNRRRFGQFACLLLPDVELSLKEVEARSGSVDGFCILTNYSGKYLGDPIFKEIFEELNHRKAVVFVHPTMPQYAPPGGIHPAIIEFPVESTRTMASLIYSGASQKYSDIKFIFSHAGGVAPFIASRLAGGAAMDPHVAENVPGGVLPELRRFYYDTALSGNKIALTALRQVADDDKILFGTDCPAAPNDQILQNIAGHEASGIDAKVLAKIYSGNAKQLLG